VEFLSPIALILLFSLALLLVGWFFLSRFEALLRDKKEDQSLLLMQQQIDQLRVQLSQALDNNTQLVQQQLGQVLGNVNERLKENGEILERTQQNLGERLDNAARVVGSVQKSLGGLEEANRKIYEVGKDIASLQEILRAPKLRGGLGEFFLEDLLAQILPTHHFAIQHAFKSGERVDAVIKLGGSLVPVDSKFPLENFKRILEAANDDERTRTKRQFISDVKKHVDAIAGKYILPDEGTYDFALMYIPAENVYYETIIKDDSEGQAIVLGLKGMKIEERAKEIIQYLSRVGGDFAKFREDFGLLGKHLGHAQSSYQTTEKRLEQFGQRLLSADANQEFVEFGAYDRKMG
jgi:DNA recombination protein RmuC